MKHHTKTLIALLSTVSVLAFAGTAAADQTNDIAQFDAQAQSLIASAPIIYRGTDWGPTPLWTVDLTSTLQTTIDVADTTADQVRNDQGLIDNVATMLWQNAGRPTAPAPVSAPQTVVAPVIAPAITAATAPSTPSVTDTAPVSSSVTDTSPAPTATAPTVSLPAAPSMSAPSGTVFAPIHLIVNEQAATQPTVAGALGKAMDAHVTLSPMVKLTVKGKTVTLARIKALLTQKHSVKVTLKSGPKGLIVTGISA